MFEDYDFVVPKDEKGLIRSLTLRTVRANEEEVLVIGVKEEISRTDKNGSIISTTVSSFCLNVEYNLGFVNTRFCEFDENGQSLYPNVNSIENISVFEDRREKLLIDNGYDGNNSLCIGFSKAGFSTFYFNSNKESNTYPFDKVRVSSEIRNYLGLHYNPETRDFRSADVNNTNRR